MMIIAIYILHRLLLVTFFKLFLEGMKMTYQIFSNNLIQVRYLLLLMIVVVSPVYAGDDKAGSLTKSISNVKRESFVKIVPVRCVALRQGQVCYQNTVITWQASLNDDYCLYSTQSVEPIQCWSGKEQGKYELDFQSSVSIEYVLRSKANQKDIAKAEVVVSWVYGNKKRRRTSWRLF